MTAEVAREILSASGAPMPARPVAFNGLFGWLSPGVTRRGVLLCGTLGFEQLSAHRAWRALADDIAASGCACLRFDYPGEGDSGDDGAGRLSSLVGAARRAVRYLREEAGAEEIVVVGLRFGALLAALAAQAGGVDRLVLVAPFASGRAYLREMRLQARTTVIWPGGVPLEPEPGTLNVHGFVLGPDLLRDIEGLDADLYGTTAVSQVLVIDRSPRASVCFAPPGARRKDVPYAKFGELLSGEMNFRCVAQVRRNFRDLNDIVVDFAAGDSRAGATAFGLSTSPGRITGRGWREDGTVFGGGLFGIVCAPDRWPIRRCCVLFVNSGTYVRSGPGRYTTRLARHLALRGIPSFRIDLSGTGDSADRRPDRSPVYNLETLDDIALAIDTLHALYDAPVVLIGFCSGAYSAFHLTCRDGRVTDAVLTNLYCFDWPSDTPLEAVLDRPTLRSPATYARSLLSANTWRRIVTGNISVAAILGGLLKARTRRFARRWSDWRRIAGGIPSVVVRVAAVNRRGGRIVLVYSAEDPGLANIQEELGVPSAKIEGVLGVGLDVVDRCDHNFSTPDAQARLTAILLDVIERRTRDADGPAANVSAMSPGPISRPAGSVRPLP